MIYYLEGVRKVVNSGENVYVLFLVCHTIDSLQKTLWKCSAILIGLKAAIYSMEIIRRNILGGDFLQLEGKLNFVPKMNMEFLKYPLARIILPPSKNKHTHWYF